MNRYINSSCPLDVEEVVNDEPRGIIIIDGDEKTFVPQRTVESFYVYKKMFLMSANPLSQERLDRLLELLNISLTGLPVEYDNDALIMEVLNIYNMMVQYYVMVRDWNIRTSRAPP